MNILLTGANGQVGHELQRSLAPLGQVLATDRRQLDMTNTAAIRGFIDSIEPDIIVNAAAYTAVDQAESEPDLARAVNADAVAELAAASAERAIPLVHFSTDYVFNGRGQRPWLESDKPDPLGVYGSSKLQGERNIIRTGCRHLILRTSWVYGTRGHNFLNTMRRLVREREQISVVDDQVGAPTWSRHIADITAQILAMSLDDPDAFWQRHGGVYHVSGSGQTSWYGFARAIFDLMATSGQPVPELQAIDSAQYPTPAMRPANSCLDNGKLQRHFGLQLPHWRDSLDLVMQD